MMMPTGFRFSPTDEELIELLIRKVSGQEMHIHGHFILEKDVYELDPQDLHWDYNAAQSNNERFYFCLREKDSREVSDQGWWRATGHVKKLYANYNNQLLVGFKRPLAFHRYKDHHHHQAKRNKAIKTNWIMHEYGLESHSTNWRLCKIKYKGKPSVQEELENMRRATAEQLLEVQQPQASLQQHNNNEQPYYYYNCYPEGGVFDFSGGQTEQQQQLDINNNNNNNNNVAENMQMEAMVMENQQQLSINALYDPCYYDDSYQLQLATITNLCDLGCCGPQYM